MRRLSRALLPPLAAFLLARALLVTAAAATERSPWSAGSWSGPDSAHYLSIAKGGYALFPCGPDDAPPGHCGNAGWMPLYPWLMRPLLAGGVVSPRWVAAGVAAASALGTLVALWTLFLAAWPRHGALALMVAAFLPGQAYLHGAFPMGLLAAAALVALHAALHERWVLAGVAGAAATLSHSVGWLLAPALLAWGVTAAARGLDPLGAARARRGAALACALTAAGVPALFALHHAALGTWDAYLRVQSWYGHHPANPISTLWAAVRPLGLGPWEAGEQAPAAQAAVVSLLSVAALGEALRRRDRESTLVALYVAVMWLVPLSLGGTVSIYRTDAALLPGMILARRAPRAAMVAALTVLVPLSWTMGRLFFELRLV